MDKKNSRISTKQNIEALWDSFVGAILEPLLFAFGLFILFARIQNIIDYITSNPVYSFWAVLETDMHLNPEIYIGFAAVYILWVISKGIKYRREKSDSKRLVDTLEGINTIISDLQKAIKDLPDKIAESIKSSENEDNELK